MKSDRVTEIKAQLAGKASPARSVLSSRYFKTGPGEYAQGDIFIGVTVPDIRRVARQFKGLALQEIEELLRSPIHEERLCALVLLVEAFARADKDVQRRIYRLYISNLRFINNWDLVDTSAPRVVGAYLLLNKDSGAILVRLAKSRDVWRRRIAILSTFAFINAGRHIPTLNIARLLLTDKHDLIQKGVGWMLREVGKRIDREIEEEFLRKYYKQMPRTMLRYSIELFPRRLQLAYLGGRI